MTQEPYNVCKESKKCASIYVAHRVTHNFPNVKCQISNVKRQISNVKWRM